ncbi:unnamed protein product [Cochlearia groenlandica]
MGNSKISTRITSPLILRKQSASYKEGEFAVAISSEEIQRDSIEISLYPTYLVVEEEFMVRTMTRSAKIQDISRDKDMISRLVAGVNCDGLVKPKKVTKRKSLVVIKRIRETETSTGLQRTSWVALFSRSSAVSAHVSCDH